MLPDWVDILGFVLCTYSKRGLSSAANYGQFRRLIPDHTDFPDTFMMNGSTSRTSKSRTMRTITTIGFDMSASDPSVWTGRALEAENDA